MYRKLYLLVFLVCVLSAAGNVGAGLVAYWRLDEGAGTTAADSSGNGYNGTIMGNPTWVPGMYKTALRLDGTGDYVDLGNPTDWPDGLSPRSLCGWGLTNSIAGGYRWFAAYGTPGTGQACFIGMNGTRAIGGGYNGDDVELAGFWEVDEWHHLALTYDGTTARLYADGVEIASQAKTWNLVLSRAYIGEQVNGAGEYWNGIVDEVCIFDQALSPAEIADVMAGMNREQAKDPDPEDEAIDIPRDVVLSWAPGVFAATHDVYFGTNWDDVNNASRANSMGVLLSQGQSDTTYDPPGRLDFERTYYWRIDEVNAAPDNTIFKGNVWSFTSEPFAYPVPNVIATSNGVSEADAGPENTVNGSGLNANDEHSTASTDMWLAMSAGEPLWIQYEFDRSYQLHQMFVWNYNVQFELLLGFGIKGVTVAYSQDGTDWTTLGDVELTRATAKSTYTYNTSIDFGGAAARYVRLTANSGYGMTGQLGLSEVRFLFVPGHAREPQPADGATDVDPAMALTWRAGRQVASHEVYIGSDPNELSLAGIPDRSSFTSADLLYAGLYYWRVDEVNEAEVPSLWEGDVWSFETAPYGVVDDMELYTDDIDAGEAIFQTWIDGYENGSGSLVGYFDAPFAEQTIVHGGGQSMPLEYNNTASPNYSEAVQVFDSPQDWTAHGIQTLGLYFRGTPGNSGQLYAKINGTKVAYDGDAADIGRALWQPWNIDLSTVGGDLRNVNELAIGVDGPGAMGMLYIDDIRLYPDKVEYITPFEPDAASLVGHYALDGNANDSSGNGYNGTAIGTPTYITGMQSQAVQLNGTDQYIDLGNPAGWPSGTSPRSMSAWARTGVVYAGWRWIAAYGSDVTSQAMFIGMSGTALYGGGYGDDVSLAGFWAVDEWHHVGLTYDGTVARLYADGVQVASAAKNWDLVPSRARIGQQVNDLNEFWVGMIDEVRIYDQALTAGEMAWLARRTTQMHKQY